MHPTWIEPGETRSFRVTDDELGEVSWRQPSMVDVDVAPERTFGTEVTLTQDEAVVTTRLQLFEELAAKAGISHTMFRVEIASLGPEEGNGQSATGSQDADS